MLQRVRKSNFVEKCRMMSKGCGTVGTGGRLAGGDFPVRKIQPLAPCRKDTVHAPQRSCNPLVAASGSVPSGKSLGGCREPFQRLPCWGAAAAAGQRPLTFFSVSGTLKEKSTTLLAMCSGLHIDNVQGRYWWFSSPRST